jgi:hypothetical protein
LGAAAAVRPAGQSARQEFHVTYHATVQDVYRKAAEEPDRSLCCVQTAPLYLPDLSIPSIMHEMNYGCGTTSWRTSPGNRAA